MPRLEANAIRARNTSTRARWTSSSAPASAVPSRASAAPGAPASCLACAAASARCARRAGSGVSSVSPLQERGRCGDAAAALRPAGGALELGRDVLVGPGRRLRAMPGTAIGIDVGVGGLRQRLVHAAAVLRRRGPVDGRAHQRMPKPHAGAELEQAGRDRGRRLPGSDTETVSRPPHEHRLSRRLGRRDEQQLPRSRRKRRQPSPEAVLDPARERRRVRQPESAGELRRRQAARQLQQRQRVAPCLGDDPVAHAVIQRPTDHRAQQGACIAIAQTLHDELRQACKLPLGASRAHREDQGDGLRDQTARNEPERLRRGPIQPLRVVDHAEQRPVTGSLRQQAQRGQTDDEAIRRVPCRQPERRGKRVALGARQTVEPIQHRRGQLLQAGERQLHLGLDSDCPHHAELRRRVDRVLQQCRLADPGLPSHHQGAALTPTDRLEEAVERLTLTAPAEQPSLRDRAGHGPGTNLHPERRRANGAAGAAPSCSSRSDYAPRFSTLVPAADSASHVPPKAVSPSPLVWPFLVSLTNV